MNGTPEVFQTVLLIYTHGFLRKIFKAFHWSFILCKQIQFQTNWNTVLTQKLTLIINE
jgi:hypothetical protein